MLQLYYWKIDPQTANFGDYAGRYLLQRLTGQPIGTNFDKQTTRYWATIGSILSHHHLTVNASVWGSGIISANATFPKPVKIYAVRGPLTRARCLKQGYDCPAVYGDPALLLPSVFQPTAKEKYRLGVVYHYKDAKRFHDRVPQPGVKFIDLRMRDGDDRAFERIINEICSCELICSSSLHGLIVAHAYQIPAVWVKLLQPIGNDPTKFLDYYQSVGVMDAPRCIDLTAVKIRLEEALGLFKGFPQPAFPINTTALRQSLPFS